MERRGGGSKTSPYRVELISECPSSMRRRCDGRSSGLVMVTYGGSLSDRCQGQVIYLVLADA